MLTGHRMTFPLYLLMGFLNEAGYPRKVGRVRRRYVAEYDVLHTAIRQVLCIGMRIGADRTDRVRELLTDLFAERDWETQPMEDLLQALTLPNLEGQPLEGWPWQFMFDDFFPVEHSRQPLPWEDVNHETFLMACQVWFSQALRAGFRYPDAAEAFLEKEPRLIGLHGPRQAPWLLFDARAGLFSGYCERLVRGYEDCYGLPQGNVSQASYGETQGLSKVMGL